MICGGSGTGGAGSDDMDGVAEEKRRLKQLLKDDDYYLKKLNNAHDLIYGNSKSPKRRNIYDEYDTARPTGGAGEMNLDQT